MERNGGTSGTECLEGNNLLFMELSTFSLGKIYSVPTEKLNNIINQPR
jgi:hypothetical protein